MEYIILFLLLINTAMFYSTIFNKKIGQTIFFSIFSYIFILFLFGILNGLYIGFITILVLNAFALIYNIYSIKHRKADIKNNILTFGLVLFSISYIIIIWSSLGRLASEWDEFSHWALVVKNMFELNSLGLGENSTVLFKWYLSGTSMFQYFCVSLAGEFKESMLYVGMNLIILSFIIPAFETLCKKSKFVNIILYFIMFFIPTMFYPTIYTSLYVDGVLALCFAYTIYSYFCNRNKDLSKFDIINMIFSFSMLILTKDFGLILSGLALLIILIDNMFILNKFSFKTVIQKNYKIVLTIVPDLAIKLIWEFNLSRLGINSGGKEASILSTIINLFKLNILDYQSEVFMSFSKAIGSQPLTKTNYLISYFIVVVLIFVIGYLIYLNEKKTNKKRVQVYTTVSIGNALIYAILLLLCYLSIFSEYEAVRLASYSRYMSSFALGILFAFIILLMNCISNNQSKYEKYVMILLVIFTFNFNFETLLSFFSGPIFNSSAEIRDEFNIFEEKTNEHVGLDEKVYFISTDNNGFDFYAAKYELTPKKMNTVWSIGHPYDEGDIWTKYIDIDDLREQLIKEYDYVYLYDIDEPFIELYGPLFIENDIKDNQLYKVNKESSKESILSFVE